MRASSTYRSSGRARIVYRISLCITLLVGMVTGAQIATADEVIILRDDAVTVRLELEMARDPVALKEGLMWRKSLARHNGMIFDFGRSRIVNMWMKNTFIPLDMLFVTESGRVVQIEENLKPHSLETVTSIVPVRYVIELNANEARRLALDIDDRVLLDIARQQSGGP